MGFIRASGGFLGENGLYLSGGGIQDADAAAYIEEAGIVSSNEILAVDTLFQDLKGDGSTTNNTDVYSELYTLNLASNTSQAAGKLNALLDSDYDLTGYNSPTLSAKGWKGNGSNMSFDTHFGRPTGIAIDAGYDTNCGFTILVNEMDTDTNNADFGSYSGQWAYVDVNDTGSQGIILGSNLSAVAPQQRFTSGCRTGVKDSTDVRLYENGIHSGTTAHTGIVSANLNYVLCYSHGADNPNTNTNRGFGFLAQHQHLTANQAKDIQDAASKYRASMQTGISITDLDTAYYIIRAEITDSTEATAVDDLITGMKSTTLWNKIHTFNPISPTSLKAAEFFIKGDNYRYSFYNTPTHSDAGITGNGSNMYGRADFSPSDFFPNYSDLGYTARIVSTSAVGWFVGTGSGTSTYTGFRAINNTGKEWMDYNGDNNPIFTGDTYEAPTKIMTSNRTAYDLVTVYTDGVSTGTNTTDQTGNAVPTVDDSILARNSNGTTDLYATGTVSFYAMHDSLTTTEITNLNTLINAYTTAVR